MAHDRDSVNTRRESSLRGIGAQTHNMKLAARAWVMALYYTLLRPPVLLLPSRLQAWCLGCAHRVRAPLLGLLETPPEAAQPPPGAAAIPLGPAEGRDDRQIELITIIGRGHSGTRAISQTLCASGVYMGSMINPSGDLLPARDLYDACRLLARHVGWKGGMEWDFSRLHTMPIPEEFTARVCSYLASVLNDKSAARGWKLPETTLVYPWIVRMFPQTKYIFWIRDPRDCIIGEHLTDDLADFGVPCPKTEDVMLRRAISWKYQYDIVKATPRPANWIEVRFEDFVLRQSETLARLEEFLGLELARIIVRPEAVGRWKREKGVNYFDFFAPAMAEYRYPAPNPV